MKSAGVDKDAIVTVHRELLEWADIIFVMEKRQRNIIQKKFKDIYKSKPIICLYITDDYEYLDPELVSVLKKKVESYLKIKT